MTASDTEVPGVESFDHGFLPGDHVMRWSRVILFPIQIHGIVLSAGPGIATIIDFGLSSASTTHTVNDSQRMERLESHTKDARMNILTLTSKKELSQWNKVNYGETLSPTAWSKLTSWLKGGDTRKEIADKEVSLNRNNSVGDTPQKECMQPTSDQNGADADRIPTDEVFSQLTQEYCLDDPNLENTKDSTVGVRTASDHVPDVMPISEEDGKIATSQLNESKQSKAAHKATKSSLPRLPKSDPPSIVLSRVRFLLSEEGRQSLPQHNLLHANSECIAVWCKTGHFSTLQARIFLHSAVFGNTKTATTVALMTSAQTVTVTSTVPASGVWGWLGFTTTTTSQVGLLTLNPWLIPVLAGFGIVAVGAPFLALLQAQKKWKEYTTALNDAFWQQASSDIYVDAIQHWSGMAL